MVIRVANIGDAEAIRRIYQPYVEETAVSFEYKTPTVEEFKDRIKNTMENYPYLVAEIDDKIVGYVYAGSFHTRAAYKHSAELSIYIDRDYRKQGLGKEMYQRIIGILAMQNVYQVHACIASPDQYDEHLTRDSELFHEKIGFKVVGRHEKCGYKFGKWYSIIWMDKNLK